MALSDIGVGRGTTIEERDRSGCKRKQWYSKQLFHQVKVLGVLIAEKYGE